MDDFLEDSGSFLKIPLAGIVSMMVVGALLLLLALPILAHADVCEIYVSGSVSGGTSFGYGADSSAVGQQVTPSNTCTVSAIGVWAANDPDSSCSQGVKVSIYSDSSGKPGSSLATGSTIACGSFPTIPTFGKATTTISYTMTAGTPYWIVLEGTAPSTSHYFQNGANTATGSLNGHRSFGGTWTVPFGTWTQWYEIDGTIASAPASLGYSWFWWW